jgi:seryl-tRNA synthetase
MTVEEKDILEKAKEIVGESDSEGYGWGGLYDVMNTIEDMIQEIQTLRNLVDECKASGSYDAAMHKRDKKSLAQWIKRFKELNKRYDELYRDFNELNNKYTEICSAYSGIPLQYVPAPSSGLGGSLVYPSQELHFVSSDAGASMAIEEAERKLKHQKGE